MTLFALLHGGMHDGSSWDRVTPELRARGYDVVSPDLPVDDEDAGAEDWARIAIDAIDAAVGANERQVIVVGHSIAGLCVPVVAARRAIREMVFVAGLIPVIGHSFAEHLSQNPGAVTFPAPSSTGEGPFGLTFEAVREGFYHDVEESLAREAFTRLRGQAFTILTERCPISKWPDASARFIVMRDDRAVNPAWSRQMAMRCPRGMVIEMDGGHSPFFARPRHLGVLLTAIESVEA
ncbi:alpha/beta fold hydrolase [Mycobacterium kyorinense]|uniref:Alpha/beta hydrolase n=1 Tax=Mycobacterium kyorinense TaxID=487514 RepID=A0A1X1XQY3_9MYCO|nr:alpha/beta hydrolase [Mycobacterium kyorinense]ORW01200.1 alpha/beta hydrolase [Mycobacterium kyorinense]